MTLAGRYSVGTVLGFGGMGEVYSGRDRFLNRPVALKILRAELARDPAVLRWFEQEARMAARLAHPHVVSVFDVGEDRGVPFLVMEVLSGRTFGDEMDSGPMAVEAVRRVAYHILGALDAAHRAGVVHGDVKPSNILEADPSSTVWKLADFGVATDLFT
ncbi:MAG: serine/threonine-protein kinase, partial [Actinomycetota bacterium]|nr:serine/threonine-protein kinase [Actinomycetota bacterium]